MNKLCRGGNANHRLSLRTAQAAGRWFGTAQIYAIFIEYAKNCFGFYTVNVNAAGVLRVAGFYSIQCDFSPSQSEQALFGLLA